MRVRQKLVTHLAQPRRRIAAATQNVGNITTGRIVDVLGSGEVQAGRQRQCQQCLRQR